MHIEDKEFVKGLLEKNNSIIEEFVALHYNNLVIFVRNYGGTIEDAEDLMQDALIVLYNLFNNKTGELKKSPSTYFIGVYRKIWFKSIRNRFKHVDNYNFEEEISIDFFKPENDYLLAIKKNERYKLYRKHFNKLGEGCRNIMKLLHKGTPAQEIIKEYNYTLLYFYKKKSLCKKELRERIYKDKKYMKLKF